MASAIYLLDSDLQQLLHRQYCDDFDSSSLLEMFKLACKKSRVLTPILEFQGCVFVYFKYDQIILMAPVFQDANVMTIMSFLSKFGELLKSYFTHYKLIDPKRDQLTVELVKDNYILIYELLDECLDFCVPQSTDFSILKEYIKLMIKPDDYLDRSHVNDQVDQFERQVENEINSSISRTAMTKIGWRPKGIFYNKNEIFVDCNEYIKFKYNYKVNKVIQNQISGELICKSYLSGMPEVRLGLNESLAENETILNNIQYHQCVELNKFDADFSKDTKINAETEDETNTDTKDAESLSEKDEVEAESNVVEFIPPDGAFKLLSYQILNTSILQPLIYLKPTYKIFEKNGNYKLRIKVELVTTFKRKFSMVDVSIKIPLIVKHPILLIDFNTVMKYKTKLGSVIHRLDESCLIWEIQQIQGTMNGEMMAEFELISENSLWEKHIENTERSKQEKNDLYYFELGSEFAKINEKSLSRTSKREKITKKKSFDKDTEHIATVNFTMNGTTYSGVEISFLNVNEPQLKFDSFNWKYHHVFAKDDDYSFILSEDQFTNLIPEESEKLLLSSAEIKTEKIKINKEAVESNDPSTALDNVEDKEKYVKDLMENKLGFDEYILENEGKE